jgi:hypothetical protein
VKATNLAINQTVVVVVEFLHKDREFLDRGFCADLNVLGYHRIIDHRIALLQFLFSLGYDACGWFELGH